MSPTLGKRPRSQSQSRASAARPKSKSQRTAGPGDATDAGDAPVAAVGGPVAPGLARACGESGDKPDAAVAIPKDSVGIDAMQGLVRRAAAYRLTYNPEQTKQLIPPEYLGFHNLNRDGIACNGDRCDTLLAQFLKNGFDKDEANRENFAIRVSGPEDSCIKYNIEVCDMQNKLATLPKDWQATGMTLAHSHVNQIFKNINAGTPSDIPGVVDSFGKLSVALIHNKDPDLARTSHTGLDWMLFPYKMFLERPQALHDISEAANIKNGAHLVETEMQALQRLARHCDAETNAAEQVCYDSVQRLLAASMPKLAASSHFRELFALCNTLGNHEATYMLSLAEFYGAFVNAEIRKLRYSTLALMGTWPGKVRGRSTASLIVAIIKACYEADTTKYLKDEFLEFISAKDIKLVVADTNQATRMDAALVALKYFNKEWMPALAAASRGLRIQLQSQNDISLAQAFLQKDTNLDTR